jgi:hypothetical protein
MTENEIALILGDQDPAGVDQSLLEGIDRFVLS